MKPLLILPLLLLSSTLFAQKLKEDQLYSTWYLDKYSDAEAYYHPPTAELQDYLTLTRDKTYQSRAEGGQSEGTWMLNTNGNYLELKSTEGETTRIYVQFVTDKSLVVTYDDDLYRAWEVHYVRFDQLKASK